MFVCLAGSVQFWLVIWHLFFPTCQVRVSRFYPNCLSPSFLFLLPSSLLHSPPCQPRAPDLRGHCKLPVALVVEVRQCPCQRECQNRCQIECQNKMLEIYMPYIYRYIYIYLLHILGDEMSHSIKKLCHGGDHSKQSIFFNHRHGMIMLMTRAWCSHGGSTNSQEKSEFYRLYLSAYDVFCSLTFTFQTSHSQKKVETNLRPMLHVTCYMDYLPPFTNIHPKSDPNVGKYSIRETHGLCIITTTPNHELVRLTNGLNLSTLRLQTSLASRRRSMTKHATGRWARKGATGGWINKARRVGKGPKRQEQMTFSELLKSWGTPKSSKSSDDFRWF